MIKGDSMNKKGFTLIELLVVIAILSVIALIAIPAVTSVINQSKMQSYKEQEKSIVNAAKTYMTTHSNELPKAYTLKCLTVDELQEAGLLKSQDIKNPLGADYEDVTEQNATFNGVISIYYDGNKYTYRYLDDMHDCVLHE